MTRRESKLNYLPIGFGYVMGTCEMKKCRKMRQRIELNVGNDGVIPPLINADWFAIVCFITFTYSYIYEPIFEEVHLIVHTISRSYFLRWMFCISTVQQFSAGCINRSMPHIDKLCGFFRRCCYKTRFVRFIITFIPNLSTCWGMGLSYH